MTYQHLITKNYPKIKMYVSTKAFHSNVNAEDLLSRVNERIAVNVANNKFQVIDEKSFFGYIHRIIFTSMIDLKRRQVKHTELENCTVSYDSRIDSNITSKSLVNTIFSEIESDRNREVFYEIFVNGEKYEDVALKMGININHLKTIIYTTRQKIFKKHTKTYREIIS